MNVDRQPVSGHGSTTVGISGISGNNGCRYRTSQFQAAAERQAAHIPNLHRWMIEYRSGQTVTVREVQQAGPRQIRLLGAKRIRGLLGEMQAQGMVRPCPVATGAGSKAAGEGWIVQTDANTVDGLLLFDLGNDALLSISEALGDERHLVGKVLAAALWQWVHPDDGRPLVTNRRVARVLAALEDSAA